ncbi:MAG: hypothetical protein DRI57_18945 [Deltaproteobacteria bacterium]|nr:MAG: hypothetical protein DRI57_18945 [Deltaproteobacteria bacterium]
MSVTKMGQNLKVESWSAMMMNPVCVSGPELSDQPDWGMSERYSSRFFPLTFAEHSPILQTSCKTKTFRTGLQTPSGKGAHPAKGKGNCSRVLIVPYK